MVKNSFVTEVTYTFHKSKSLYNGSLKLHKTLQKIKISFTWLSREIGISFEIIWNIFSRLMTCSTKIVT